MDDGVTIWTDGSGRAHAVRDGHAGGFGYVATYGSRRIEGSGCIKCATSNQMELAAIYVGLRAVRHGFPIEVMSDSKYSVMALTVWRHKWKMCGWINSVGGDVANRRMIEAIGGLIEEHEEAGGEVSLVHIRGHVGITENERADTLAGIARKEHLKLRNDVVHDEVQRLVDSCNL